MPVLKSAQENHTKGNTNTTNIYYEPVNNPISERLRHFKIQITEMLKINKYETVGICGNVLNT